MTGMTIDPPALLVFTDLDGTFLDHHSYDYTPALAAVQRLSRLGALLVPVTSKTMAEINALNLPLSPAVAIAENGMVTCEAGQEIAP